MSDVLMTLGVQALLFVMTLILAGLGWSLKRVAERLISSLEVLLAVPNRVTNAEELLVMHGDELKAHGAKLADHNARIIAAEVRLDERKA